MQLRYFDIVGEQWRSANMSFCGTGASFHEIAPGETFGVSVFFPKDLVTERVIVEFTRYLDADGNDQIVEQVAEIRRN